MNNIDLNEKEEKLVVERFSQLKTERNKYISKWKDIENYVALTNNVNYAFDDEEKQGTRKDVYINDPAGFICTNQAGDYLAGILWNKSAIALEPTEAIKKEANSELEAFYKRATERLLEQINATDAGFLTVLKSYCYDQFSYGTSGIGVFKSKEYVQNQSDCCLNFKTYGVYNSCIDEGSNNKINVVYSVFNWTVSRIIEEFCIQDGQFIEEAFNQLPEEIKKLYNAGKLNDKKKLVYGILPNNFYQMNKRGKVGAKFKGYWFLENSKKVFFVDYYAQMPIAFCRFIKPSNQVYGESPGTLAISTIKILNHVKGKAIDNIEKNNDPAIGMFSGALVKGNVLNRSAGEVTMFNPESAQNGKTPVFPISPVGDISAIVNYLLPEEKKDITNIYKIDNLLDFNNQTAMTATESSFRMSIRGKSINGLLSQQKAECIEVLLHRAISIIQECELFGYDIDSMPEMTEEDVIKKQQAIEDGNIIPDAVLNAMKNGRRWYKIKYNGEIEKLDNAELYESIGRFLQYLASALQIKPELQHAINDYEFVELVKNVSNLSNSNIIKSKREYKAILEQIQQAQAQVQAQQMMLQQGAMLKDMAGAQKDEAIAQKEMRV